MSATLEVVSVGNIMIRPCVDCGLKTGRFCDLYKAEDRFSDEEWALGQMTPLCSYCCRKNIDLCHFCRNQKWVREPSWEEEK